MRTKTVVIASAFMLMFLTVSLMPLRIDTRALETGSVSRLTAEEAALVASLDIDYAMEQLGIISGMGEKVAGTEEERLAQQYVYNKLSEMPLDEVVIESFPTTSWQHEGDAIRVVSPTTAEFLCSIYGYSYGIWGEWFGKKYYFGNMNSGKTLRALVVDVGYGTASEFEIAGDLDGAIALVRRDDNLQAWPNVMTEEAAIHGASAIVNYGYYGDIVHPDGVKQDVSGGPIPEFAISVNSASYIQDLLENSPVILELEGRADAVTEKKGESVNVAGYMYGTTYPDEYVVFSGHIDCWWNGTNDDTSSIAAVLEFARMFSEAREAGVFTNERTLVFLSVGAEEFGGPWNTWYDWLIGSYEFVVAHPEILEGLVLELNMDGVSFKKTSGRYWVENTWEVNGFVADAISDLGMTGEMSYYNPIWSWTDAWSFGAKGGGSTVQVMWAAGYDAIYHTQLDNMDLADEEPLKNVLQLYTVLGTRADHAIVMPFDFTPTVNWAASYLWSEESTVPYEAEWFATASAALNQLEEKAAAINAYAQELKLAYETAETEEERAAIRENANAPNRATIDARRTITPWTLGEGGTMGSWDVFLRSDQHAHDLGYIDAAISALSRGRGQIHTATSALEHVYSMEWGHVFSPEVYHEVMASMINDAMYWGDDFDQQQKYVNVHAIYTGLKAGTLSIPNAVSALNEIRNTQLIPWLEEDLATLAWAWTTAASILNSALP